ncbi:tRNA-binding protein [Streptomyces melanogenes]|uniref:tRNA-binding protein n=1 Tax=Streptomyces melanogenes TaxID=67326 RepID=UPI00167DC9B5|nr:tRNA-binding protein [Streptomyces melanogenes]GGP91328.1 tRNA-binding protein [Streptomyces melanogenes]
MAADGITITDFLDIDIRAGRIVRAERFPRARRPAYKLWIDFGDLGVRKSSAQITDVYALDDLEGRLVMAVVNLPPRQVADFMSEVLVLGVPDEDGGNVILIGPDREVKPGSRLL